VSGFLTTAWFRDLEDAAVGATLPGHRGVRVVLQQVIDRGSDGVVSYALVLADGRVSTQLGDVPGADVTFRTDYDTAAAVSQGRESAQAAFMRGRLQIGGDIGVLLRNADVLAEIDDVFAPVRAITTY
jgi:hypothetical protein